MTKDELRKWAEQQPWYRQYKTTKKAEPTSEEGRKEYKRLTGREYPEPKKF